MEPKTRLLDPMREVLRLQPRSARTEEASIGWARRCIVWHGQRHPKAWGAAAIRACLSALAIRHNVAASTPHGARKAWRLLSRAVVQRPCPPRADLERAKRPRRVPTVCTPDEVRQGLRHRSGPAALRAGWRDGAG